MMGAPLGLSTGWASSPRRVAPRGRVRPVPLGVPELPELALAPRADLDRARRPGPGSLALAV